MFGMNLQISELGGLLEEFPGIHRFRACSMEIVPDFSADSYR